MNVEEDTIKCIKRVNAFATNKPWFSPVLCVFVCVCVCFFCQPGRYMFCSDCHYNLIDTTINYINTHAVSFAHSRSITRCRNQTMRKEKERKTKMLNRCQISLSATAHTWTNKTKRTMKRVRERESKNHWHLLLAFFVCFLFVISQKDPFFFPRSHRCHSFTLKIIHNLGKTL